MPAFTRWTWPRHALAVASASLVILAGCTGGTAGTSTSVPAPASPSPSVAASPYGRDAIAVLESLAAASTGVAESMANAEPASDAWRSTVRSRLKALADVEARAGALRPSPAEENVHQQLLVLSGEMRRVSDLIAAGLDPVDPDRLQQAAQILSGSVARTAALRLQLRAS